MPSKRKRFNEREVIETLAWQGIFVPCHRCKLPFFVSRPPTFGDLEGGASSTGLIMMQLRKIEREHLHEYKLGGADTPYNCRYSCSDCHKVITNGTKATSAGSSKHRIAKVRRLTGQTKGRPKKKWASRPMQSRPFEKRKP